MHHVHETEKNGKCIHILAGITPKAGQSRIFTKIKCAVTIKPVILQAIGIAVSWLVLQFLDTIEFSDNHLLNQR